MGMELREFDIRYNPRMTIKGQALVNFVTEIYFTNYCPKKAEVRPEQIG